MVLSFEEAERKVAAYQADHATMSLEECLAWIEQEKKLSLLKALPAKPKPVTMEDLLDAAAETPEGEKVGS